MSNNYKTQSQRIDKPVNHLYIKFILVFILLLPLNYRTESKALAQDDTQELQSSDIKSYLPILNNSIGPVYYVSPLGNDNNPGTYNLPWKTLHKAAKMVTPGSTVYLRNGSYHEMVNFTVSGTATRPIDIRAYPGEYPVVDGNMEFGYLLNIAGDYNRLIGIEFRNSGGQGLYVTGSYDVIDNVFVHHCMTAGIWIGKGHHSEVNNSRVWRTSLENEYRKSSTNSTGISAARDGVQYATIRNNEVWEVWGQGISTFEADHTIIEDNISHDNLANLYVSDSTNVLVQRNFIYSDPSSYTYPYGAGSGITLGDETYDPPSSNITLINNIVVGNHINFYWWRGTQGGGMINVLIANNTFVNSIETSGVKIMSGTHQNVNFSNNIVVQDGSLPLIMVYDNPEVHFSDNLWSKPPWEAAVSPNDIIDDPQFARIGSIYSPTWYKLLDSSLAINQALSLNEVYIDYFGYSRDVLPDIGASEFFFDQ